MTEDYNGQNFVYKRVIHEVDIILYYKILNIFYFSLHKIQIDVIIGEKRKVLESLRRL